MTNIITQLRKSQKVSQGDLAKRLGMSRPTLLAIEKNERELNASEIKILSEIFDISVESLLQGKMPIKKQIDTRISIPQRNLEKFKEVLLYILSKVSAKPNVGQTVLYKLLYFMDFDYYEKFEEQLIGATYIKNHRGPTPIEFAKVVDEMKKVGEIEEIKSKYFNFEQKKYIPVRDPNLSLINAQELKLIDETLAKHANKNATEFSNYSHDDVPWITAQDGEPIEYESVFYRTPEFSVRNYEHEL